MEAFREPVVAMSTNSASTVHTFNINRGSQYLRTPAYNINDSNEYSYLHSTVPVPTVSMKVMSTYCTVHCTVFSAITYSINEGNYVVPSPTVPVPTVLM